MYSLPTILPQAVHFNGEGSQLLGTLDLCMVSETWA